MNAFLSILLLLSLFLAGASDARRLRLAAANTSSGNYQSYDPGHGARILQGLDADIVMIQEFNYGNNSNADISRFVSATFGEGFFHYRETGAQIPNGIISRYPILSSGEWTDPRVSNRDFAWARIDIPGDTDLWAVSIHFLTSSASNRNAEAAALVAYILQHVPAGDYLVIGGDFNSANRNETQFATLAEVVHTSGPHPADGNGNENTNAGRARPYDSLFPDADLFPFQVPVVIGERTFPNGLVVDTRIYTPISDLSPALVSDSAADGMQHMTIVKDFLLPLPADPSPIPVLETLFVLAPPARGSIAFASIPSATYRVEASSDLSGAWLVLGEVEAASAVTTVQLVSALPSPGQLRDLQLGLAPRRFYRIVRK